MGIIIGQLLGKVEASEFYEYPGKKMIIKIKVSLNVSQPIAAGILIGNANDGTNWIDFRYERLPQVCFKCGIVGHAENLCHNPPLEDDGSPSLGPWIRSNIYGRRIMEAKDKKYHSNPSMAKNYGSYSPPIPAAMLKEMAAMKIKDDQEAACNQSNRNTDTEASSTPSNTTTGQHNSANSQIITNKSINQAKRQRMDSNSPTNVDITMVESCSMAGPAKQASQPQ
jgi:hypothetical protein